MDKKAIIYVLGEEHPSDLRKAASSFIEIAQLGIEKVRDGRMRGEERKRLIEYIKILSKEASKMLDCANEIRRTELKILDIATSGREKEFVIYLEGDRDVIKKCRPEIVEFANSRNLRLVCLDEGNLKYKGYNQLFNQLIFSLFHDNEYKNTRQREGMDYDRIVEDYRKRLEKAEKEAQEGREDLWVETIEKTIGDAKYAIVIVGAAHVSNNKNENNYETISQRPENIGFFDKKLKERGYEVIVQKVISYLLYYL